MKSMSEDHAEEALVGAAQNGSVQAFTELARLYQERIYHTIFGLTHNHADADDLTQDTFMTAYRGLKRFKHRSSFFTWLYRIAINLTFNHLKRMKRERLGKLREKLLGVKGIGPETADSILLYGLKKPIFVVDAYTTRILSRHGIISEKAVYEEVQKLFMDHLPHDEKLFNEYHALFVHLGKTLCKKIPKCDLCPLKSIDLNKMRDKGIRR